MEYCVLDQEDKMKDMNMNDLMKASADDVAIAFIAWLAGDLAAEPNHRKYALHLTEARTCRLHTPQYAGPYNLFAVRGLNAVEAALRALENTEAYRATKRSNGGNGVFQAAFGKLRLFWSYLQGGGSVPAADIQAAAPQWAIVRETIRSEMAGTNKSSARTTV